MPSRFQKFTWRIQDLANPRGVPIFLSFVVFLLLIINVIIAWEALGITSRRRKVKQNRLRGSAAKEPAKDYAHQRTSDTV